MVNISFNILVVKQDNCSYVSSTIQVPMTRAVKYIKIGLYDVSFISIDLKKFFCNTYNNYLLLQGG